jgi:hypothetical protein
MAKLLKFFGADNLDNSAMKLVLSFVITYLFTGLNYMSLILPISVIRILAFIILSYCLLCVISFTYCLVKTWNTLQTSKKIKNIVGFFIFLLFWLIGTSVLVEFIIR